MTDLYQPTQAEKAGLEVAIAVLANKFVAIYDSGENRHVLIVNDENANRYVLMKVNQKGGTGFPNIEQLRGTLIAIGFTGTPYPDGMDYARRIGG